MAATTEPELPRGVALTWGVAERPQRGPKRELSIERIVEAAITIADADGLAAVSMNRVATSLGFTTMSLYRYVTSKDDLLVLMQEEVIGVPIPPESAQTTWRDGLREWVVSTMAVAREHPWFLDIPISGVPMTPNNLTIVDWGLRTMRDIALTDQEKVSTILLLSSYSRAVGQLENDISRTRQSHQDGVARPDAALSELVSEERFPYLRPAVLSGAYSGDPDDDYDDFEFGLERILDGIQHYLEHGSGAVAGAATAGATAKAAETQEPYPKDKAVREAAKARREAEVKLREATKREKEQIQKARERERARRS